MATCPTCHEPMLTEWPHVHRQPVAANDPEFYCHGQKCIDGGCSPLLCKQADADQEMEFFD